MGEPTPLSSKPHLCTVVAYGVCGYASLAQPSARGHPLQRRLTCGLPLRRTLLVLPVLEIAVSGPLPPLLPSLLGRHARTDRARVSWQRKGVRVLFSGHNRLPIGGLSERPGLSPARRGWTSVKRRRQERCSTQQVSYADSHRNSVSCHSTRARPRGRM